MRKLRNVLFWSGIFLVILTYIIIKPLENLDEMWNFNVARCIANGLIPYKEISMVSTPLLGFLTAIFLRIFGTEMFITRVLAAVIAIINLGVIYRICISLKIPNSIAKILILIIMFIMKNYYCLDYNFLVVTFVFFIILLEIKSINQRFENKKIHMCIGIIAGLSICTKQSVGFVVSLFVILSQLFFIKDNRNIKLIIKNILLRIIGILIPIIVFIIYLLICGAFYEFIDYAIVGLKTFSNNVPYINLVKSDEMFIKVLSIVIPILLIISIIVNCVLKILKKEDNYLFVLTVYCIPMITIIYPISDKVHFLTAILPYYIIPAYVLGIIITNIKKLNFEYIFEFFEIVSFIWIILFTGYTEIRYRDELGALSKYRALNHFRNIIVEQNLEKTVKGVDNYIVKSEKAVYILDSNAALYMIPIDRYNKDYDLFAKGNLGSGGEENQINRIENRSEDDTKYLILNENYKLNWQTPTKVLDYIKENFVKTGTIGIYNIYEREQIVEYEQENEK